MRWPIPDLVELFPEPREHDARLGDNLASVFLHMTGSIGISAACALLLLRNVQLRELFVSDAGLTAAGILTATAPLLFVLGMGRSAEHPGAAGARLLLLAYAVLLGLSLGILCLGLTGRSAAAPLIAAGGGFAVLAAIGGAADRNLSVLGSFLAVALPGLLLVLAIDLLLPSYSPGPVISAAGVLGLGGMAACETDRIKREYSDPVLPARQPSAAEAAWSLYRDPVTLILGPLGTHGGSR